MSTSSYLSGGPANETIQLANCSTTLAGGAGCRQKKKGPVKIAAPGKSLDGQEQQDRPLVPGVARSIIVASFKGLAESQYLDARSPTTASYSSLLLCAELPFFFPS